MNGERESSVERVATPPHQLPRSVSSDAPAPRRSVERTFARANVRAVEKELCGRKPRRLTED
jgi:hypothetical protein